MITIAIIPKSLDQLKTDLKKLTFAENIQIDVVDGKFVHAASWPYEPAGSPQETAEFLKKFSVEVDLMTKDQVGAGKQWLEAGASGLVFHLEGLSDPEQAFSLRLNNNFKLGLAINNDTTLDSLYKYMDSVDFVQLMGIATIGSQGQPFDTRVLDRIVTLRTLYPELEISIDGAVSKETLPALKNAGASRFVVGSAILKSPNPQEVYDELLKIAESD